VSGENYKWQGNFCIEVSPTANTVVIFGASGDLAHKKLIPSLYNLYCRSLFHERSIIIGCARTEMSDDAFRDDVGRSLKSKSPSINNEKLNSFLKKIYYVAGQYDSVETYNRLSEKIKSHECGECLGSGRIFYLSTPGNVSSKIIEMLGHSRLVEENYDGIPWRNVVIEKPFGHDLESALALDRELRKTLQERQIYRIDHYLGKDTVQNIMMMRFANRILEPVWNSNYIDHVQITVAESIGIENRAGYYEQAGLLRDMFQNHILQILSLIAMEPPESFDAAAIRSEKVKLLRSIRPFPMDRLNDYIVRGQYERGAVDGREVCGYLEEKGVNPDSKIETYAAAKILIENWRWVGVPFYLRSGKRLPKRVSEVAIFFKKIPHSIFHPIKASEMPQNVLVLNIQPEDGFGLTIMAKEPGPKLCMGSLTMDFKYADILEGSPSDAYERLLLDCMLNDQTLFIRNDNIETAWALLTPVLKAWESCGDKSEICKLHKYPGGSWGPEAADRIITEEGYSWRNL